MKLTEVKLILTSELREHEHAGIIPEMTVEEWAEFSENVRDRGEIIKPLEILPDGRVIDGRHRLKAAREHGIEYVPTIEKPLDDASVVEYMRDSGLRRNLTKGQRAAIVLKCEPLVSEMRTKAKGRQQEAGVKYGRGLEKLSPDLGKAIETHTSKKLAEQAGIGKSSMEYLQAVQRKAPDLFERVASGEIVIDRAYKEMKRREQPTTRPSNVVQLPKRPSAKRTRISDIAHQIEQEPKVETIDSDSLSADNIIRHRTNNEMLPFASKLVYDHDALQEASRETVDAYLSKLKHIVEGALLIISEFDDSEYIKEFTEQVATIIRQSKTEEGQRLIESAIGGSRK